LIDKRASRRSCYSCGTTYLKAIILAVSIIQQYKISKYARQVIFFSQIQEGVIDARMWNRTSQRTTVVVRDALANAGLLPAAGETTTAVNSISE
jgi:hypothetical protein